jgi:hypothetical protein
MRTRPITVLAAALALLAGAPLSARAQSSTPTPTPTATATATPAKKPKDVQKVYDDYHDHGKIDVCAHSQAALQKTLDTIDPSFDQDYPDFRDAVQAGIEKHKAGKCTSSPTSDTGSGSSGSTGSTGSSGSSGSTGTGTGVPAPTPAPTADSGAQPGTLPSPTPDKGGAAVPPEDNIPPQNAQPPAITPVPQATVPPPAVTPVATPAVVHEGHRSLTIPIILIAIALLGAAALGLWALLARRNPRLAHAWREAAFRTRGTWADFSDWLRLGR